MLQETCVSGAPSLLSRFLFFLSGILGEGDVRKHVKTSWRRPFRGPWDKYPRSAALAHGGWRVVVPGSDGRVNSRSECVRPAGFMRRSTSVCVSRSPSRPLGGAPACLWVRNGSGELGSFLFSPCAGSGVALASLYPGFATPADAEWVEVLSGSGVVAYVPGYAGLRRCVRRPDEFWPMTAGGKPTCAAQGEFPREGSSCFGRTAWRRPLRGPRDKYSLRAVDS